MTLYKKSGITNLESSIVKVLKAPLLEKLLYLVIIFIIANLIINYLYPVREGFPQKKELIIKTNEKPDKVLKILQEKFKDISLVGYGKSIEIFKQVGNPEEVVKKFNLEKLEGSHGIGHTRMATESAITTNGSHPYSTGEDECLVHNGSLSNHNNLRRELKKKGSKFNSDNDTEVAAGYISNNLKNKKNLKDTLLSGLKDLDGFYTFITGTRKGFAIVRDEIACKPAVIAETKDYVAIASEFQAMAHLPKVNNAKIFEPEPGIVYMWGN